MTQKVKTKQISVNLLLVLISIHKLYFYMYFNRTAFKYNEIQTTEFLLMLFGEGSEFLLMLFGESAEFLLMLFGEGALWRILYCLFCCELFKCKLYCSGLIYTHFGKERADFLCNLLFYLYSMGFPLLLRVYKA